MLKHPYFYVMIVLAIVVSIAWGGKIGLGKQYACSHGYVLEFNALKGSIYLNDQNRQYVGMISNGNIEWQESANNANIALPKTFTFSTGSPEVLIKGGFAGSGSKCKLID